MIFKRRDHEFETINFWGFNNLQLLKLQLPLGRLYFHLNYISTVHIIFILCSFLSRVKFSGNVLVFIAQLVEHYSADAEAMGSNLVEVTVIRI